MTKRSVADKKDAKQHLRRGALVLCCLFSALVLVLGVGASNLQKPQSQDPQTSGSSQPYASISSNTDTTAEESSTYEVTHDEDYGDIEAGKVLVLIDGEEDLAQVNMALAENEFATTKDVSDQDPALGLVEVEVEVEGSASMDDLLASFETQGLKAQPNYIYRAAEEETDATSKKDANQEDDAQNNDDQASTSPLNDGDVVFALMESFAHTQDEASDQSESNPTNILSTQADGVTINDSDRSQEWYLESMDLYRAWGIMKSSDDDSTAHSVAVAVIDTGCNVAHPDLVDNLVAYYNASDMKLGSEYVNDTDGHGTHVAGIIAADANNGIGVAGTSYDAGLVIIKGCNSNGDFSTVTITRAYTWLMQTQFPNSKTNAELYNVRVVNMSLGGVDTSASAKKSDDGVVKKVQAAKAAGILTVCAAGNSDSSTGANPPYAVYPGDIEDCLTVINLDHNTTSTPNDSSSTFHVSRASGSNYNKEGETTKNVSAPGTMIYSTSKNGGYVNKSGTSMASPAVAGVAALLFAQDPTLSAADAKAILEKSATDIGDDGWDRETGYGEVDAYKALQLLSATLATKSVSFGESTPISVICPDGSSVPASEYAWTSSDPSVISVSGTTLIPRRAYGGATITGVHKSGISTLNISIPVQVSEIDFSQATVVFQDPAPYTYSGTQVCPAVSVRYKGSVLQEGSDYVVEYGTNLAVADGGSVTIKPGTNGGTGSKTEAFAISPLSLSSEGITLNPIESKTYTGSAIEPDPVLFFNGAKLVKGRDYTVSYENNVEIGNSSAVVKVTGAGNFKDECEQTFSIYQELANISVGNLERFYEYTGNPVCPLPAVTYNGKTLERNVDYMITYRNNVSVASLGNSAVATITGIGKYTGTAERTFTIVAKNISNGAATISSISDQTYTGSAIKPYVAVTCSGKTLANGVDYDVAYLNNTNVGTATVKITGKNNYRGTATATFKIKAVSIKLASISGVQNKTYTGSAQTQSITVAHNGKTLVRDKDYTITYANNTKVGTATMYVTGIGAYTDTTSRTFHISAPASSSSASQSNGTSSSTGKNTSNSTTSNGTSSGNSTSNATNTTTTKPSTSLPSAPAVSGTWVKSGSKWWYRYDSATKNAQKKAYPANEWVVISGKRYHFDAAGYMHTKWQRIDGAWYYFAGDGALRTGWQKAGGKWYYLEPDSARMAVGWKTVGSSTYYLNGSGTMMTGWQKLSGSWYYFKGSGARASGWTKVGKSWYYLDPANNAIMKTGWLDSGSSRYYLKASGAMATGWQKIGGYHFYFNNSGVMQKNTWIGRYHLNANGVWDRSR